MTTNNVLKNIYQSAIDNKIGYNLAIMTYFGKVGVGTSNPDKYSSCSSFAGECQSIITDYCKSYIVKNGVGINHEFIDTTLAASFLNNKPMNIFLTKYPEDGYNILYINEDSTNDKLNILGTASPLICRFQSLTDIIKQFRAPGDKELRIHARGFDQSGYLDSLKNFLNNTDPQSITDYYVSQYVSGGGDPNTGNIGFAQNYHDNKYKYIFTKIDLGASFKNYSKISGSKPTLEDNLYAFNIPDNIKDSDALYNYVIQHGNIIMPGDTYSYCKPSWKPWSPTCQQWNGHGNAGFYNGVYDTPQKNLHGIDMKEYVQLQHLQYSISKLCKSSKDDIINTFKSAALKIYELLSNSQERDSIPIINEPKENFTSYIDGRANFISSRYDHLCDIMKESNISDSNEQVWYESPYYYIPMGIGAITLVGYGIYSCAH